MLSKQQLMAILNMEVGRLGKRVVFTDDDKQEIKRLYEEEKLFISEIVRKLGSCRKTIIKILEENGVEIDHRGKRRNKYIIDGNIAKIELKRRGMDSLWTLIDLDDLERVLNYPYSWCAGYRKNTDSWYARATIHKLEKVNHNSHGIYLNYFIAEVDSNSGYCVDHKNHDTLDNRKENLRITETIHNTKHRKGRNSNNKSGYRNVCWLKTEGKWVVQLQINGKNQRLGYFDDVHEAGKLAKEMRRIYYGEFSGGN